MGEKRKKHSSRHKVSAGIGCEFLPTDKRLNYCRIISRNAGPQIRGAVLARHQDDLWRPNQHSVQDPEPYEPSSVDAHLEHLLCRHDGRHWQLALRKDLFTHACACQSGCREEVSSCFRDPSGCRDCCAPWDCQLECSQG